MIRLMLLAFVALVLAGCVKHSASVMDGDPFNTPTGPKTVYIWNGKTCVEATRTPQQLLKTEVLRTGWMQNGEMKTLQVHAEDVPPTVIKKLYTEGGTIVLPNGEKMIFPAGSTRGTVVVQNGKIPAGNGEFIAVDATDGTLLQQKAFVQSKSGVLEEIVGADSAAPAGRQQTVTTLNVAELQDSAPDDTEWWKSQAAVDAAAKDGIKVPASSVQGRVGYAGVSYGMGTIGKP